jgi:hypothetical protein
MAFEFIANPMGETDSLRIIQLSLTTLAARGIDRTSYGTLWMFFLTWLVGALIVLAETERRVRTGGFQHWASIRALL